MNEFTSTGNGAEPRGLDHSWREPLVVLDAGADIVVRATERASEMSAFTEASLGLLNELSDRLLTSAEVSGRLHHLSDLAICHARTFDLGLPTSEESSLASRAESSGLRDQEIEERIKYDEFFGIRRAAWITDDRLAQSILTTFAFAASDLADSQIGIHELIAILRGFVLATAWISPASADAEQDGSITVELSPIVRFRLGHAVFAVFCNFATHSLRAVLRSGVADEDELSDAATFVRSSTAAMWYSVSFPRLAYANEVRPLMDAASTKDHGFSGLDNFDFRRLREAWEEVGARVGVDLIVPSAEAHEALRRLFETILEDNEHHILIAAELVGMLPSLKYERIASKVGLASGVPAVAALRMNADERRLILNKIEGE